MSVAAFDLSGVRVRVEGAGTDVPDALAERWARYAVAPAGPTDLAVVVKIDGRFRHGRVLTAKTMASSFTAGGARFRMTEGEIEVTTAGNAEARIGPGAPANESIALMNLMHAALAWWLPSRSIVVVHAAGIVRRDRAYILVGPSGCGKSTWSRAAGDAGCDVLSEDVVWIDVAGRPQALSVPFRSDLAAPMGPGRHPLAAILFPRRGAPARLDAVDPIVAHGRVVANLPFVAERHTHDDDLDGTVDRVLGTVPCHELTFAPDPSFLAILDDLP